MDDQSSTITIELMGQQMIFLNGGPEQVLTPAFSYSVACKDQAEIDRYWDKLLEGGKPDGLRLADGQVRLVLANRAGEYWRDFEASEGDGRNDEHD